MAATQHRKQEQEPAGDEVVEVAPQVLRIQLPIRMPGLGHVNAYALVDARGAAVVDPGFPGPSSWRALEHGLRQADIPIGRVHTVLVTHSHPDHYGGAGRLAREAGADLVAHAAFSTWQAPHRCADHDHGPGDPCEEDEEEAEEAAGRVSPPWSRPTPWGGTPPRPPLKRRMQYALMRRLRPGWWAPPQPTRRIVDGEPLKLAGRDWFARHTPGHTADHLCLHDPAERLLISGDHVLPTITPHISGITGGPDPLADFLRSLDGVAALPEVSTVLPAHGHPFDDLPGRVDDIKEHHRRRLSRLQEISRQAGWATVPELSRHLFRRRSWGPMADSETYAHLEHLRLAGLAERRRVDGRLEYLAG